MLGELYSMIVIRYNIPQNTGDNARMRNNSRENISRIRNPVMPAIAKPNNKPVIVAMILFAVFVLFTVITVTPCLFFLCDIVTPVESFLVLDMIVILIG